MMNYENDKFLNEFKEKIKEISPEKILFVCSKAYDRYGYRKALDEIGASSVPFADFEPCPEVSSVKKGIEAYNAENCDFIVAVGGGSAIDTAKGIKYYSEKDFEILAVPTTAGTGAEVTRFSVLYKNADKESVSSYSIIPEYYIADYTTLKSLPYEQKVVTALDAFCHSVEAFWSLGRTDESVEYSRKSLEIFNDNFLHYIDGHSSTYKDMLYCSTLAGKAINIARTCAPHAFSYKLHKIKGFFHGKAVAVCLAYIWKYMSDNSQKNGLSQLLADTENITGFTPAAFIEFLSRLGMLDDCKMTKEQFDETVNGVNTDRLKNTPMNFSRSDISAIYSSFVEII